MMILKEQWLIVTPNTKSLTGDFNAKIGTKTKEEDFKSMGAFGTWERNERGDRLTEFAEERELLIANFRGHKKIQKKKTTKTPKQTQTTTTTTDTGLEGHQMEKQQTNRHQKARKKDLK